MWICFGTLSLEQDVGQFLVRPHRSPHRRPDSCFNHPPYDTGPSDAEQEDDIQQSASSRALSEEDSDVPLAVDERKKQSGRDGRQWLVTDHTEESGDEELAASSHSTTSSSRSSTMVMRKKRSRVRDMRMRNQKLKKKTRTKDQFSTPPRSQGL